MTLTENKVVAALNKFFEENKIDAIAYRIKQQRYTSQTVDVLVDSRHWKYYLAIEIKSISVAKGTKSLYFTQHFNTSGGMHQIERISKFLRRSGRIGFLIVELRRGAGHPTAAHMVKWREVESRFRSGKPGFSIEDISKYPEIRQNNGCYIFDAKTLEEAM